MARKEVMEAICTATEGIRLEPGTFTFVLVNGWLRFKFFFSFFFSRDGDEVPNRVSSIQLKYASVKVVRTNWWVKVSKWRATTKLLHCA